jgi:hypothetical protein
VIQGVIGNTGSMGTTGSTGPTGSQGIQGIQGPTGPSTDVTQYMLRIQNTNYPAAIIPLGYTGLTGPSGAYGVTGVFSAFPVMSTSLSKFVKNFTLNYEGTTGSIGDTGIVNIFCESDTPIHHGHIVAQPNETDKDLYGSTGTVNGNYIQFTIPQKVALGGDYFYPGANYHLSVTWL